MGGISHLLGKISWSTQIYSHSSLRRHPTFFFVPISQLYDIQMDIDIIVFESHGPHWVSIEHILLTHFSIIESCCKCASQLSIDRCVTLRHMSSPENRSFKCNSCLSFDVFSVALLHYFIVSVSH